jgi:DNA mismatch repair protein MutS
MSIFQEYQSYHKEYQKKFGPKTCILMQVGSFYEMYSTDTEGPNLKEISGLLNIVFTKKDKTNLTVSSSNPYMLGFPLVSSEKFIILLMSNGFTVATIDQVTPPPEPERKCTNVFSPSTFIATTPDINTSYAVLLYFDYEAQNKLKKNLVSVDGGINNVNRGMNYSLLCVGLSAIDLTTGKTKVDEGISTIVDTEIAIDLASRFLASTTPKEIFIMLNGSGKMSLDDIIEYLQIDKNIIKIKIFDAKYSKLLIQEEYLKKCFKQDSMVSIIESLNLESVNYARTSLIMLLDYINDYNPKIIQNLTEPEFSSDSDRLVLGNNAQYQLAIYNIDDNNYQSGIKFRSLLDVVCCAQTPMGKRYVKNILVNPFTSTKKIKAILSDVDMMIQNKFYKDLQSLLNGITDIEKLRRKMSYKIIQPYELADLLDAIILTKNIIEKVNHINKETNMVNGRTNMVNGETNKKFKSFKIDKTIITRIDEFIKYFDSTFIYDELKKNLLKDIKSCFIKEKVDKELDKLTKKLNLEYDEMNKLQKQFNRILSIKSKSTKKTKSKQPKKVKKINNKKEIKEENKEEIDEENDKELVKLSHSTTDGYYLELSLIRYNVIKEYLKKIDDSDAEIDSDEDDDNISIDFSNYKIQELKSKVKIYMKKKDSDPNVIEEVIELVEKLYGELQLKINSKYFNLFEEIITIITQIDYLQSNAECAEINGYCKPNIIDGDESSINVKNIRHPIVEKIIDFEYIPHSIHLDEKLSGLLIYGLNSSGKSVLMKAIGLTVIMAQCGMYVPADSCDIIPFKSIFTRITGNDNIFKGQSSFTLEMVELNTIIKRADCNSLIIGDEICRGTEHISGNAIVASTIVTLSKLCGKFIFATHLHELVHLESIKKLENVKAFHLSVDYDQKSDTLIYDRRLKEGSGDKIYGILVAKYIIQNKDFMDLTLQIKNELTNNFTSMISGKTSRYNSSVLMMECEICHEKNVDLESHHINFQKNCDENKRVKNKKHIQKDSKANLAVICEECHNKIHSNEIELNKKIKTSKGVKIT